MEKFIYTENICRDFRTGSQTVHALKDINISIDQGTLTVLRGRSGSGKTTLMNILGALDSPTGGKVYLEGKEITSVSEAAKDKLRRGKISFVFQSVALLGQMSAYENVEFMLRIAGKPLDKKRIEQCFDLVGLSQRMQHMPAQLSGGEQQRTAIARAIVHHPSIIFADEPTAQLDSKTAYAVVHIFRKLVQEEGMTILMTTHDPNMLQLADHVYTLEDGQVVGESFPLREGAV